MAETGPERALQEVGFRDRQGRVQCKSRGEEDPCRDSNRYLAVQKSQLGVFAQQRWWGHHGSQQRL
jgi:hypothetical protein